MFRKVIHLLAIPALAAAISLAACGESKTNHKLPSDPDVQATEALSKKIEEFTGGHTKIVWSTYVGSSTNDILANYTKLELWGIDTRDGKGVRKILDEVGNYARPLVTPSGEAIVFSRKNTDRNRDSNVRKFKPVVCMVDWKGERVEELGKGYAVDVWRDPQTRIEWAYVVDLLPTQRTSMFASKLERFQLLDPGERETVWEGSKMSTANIQLSRDGKRASALFPWPNAGVLNLETGENWINQNGCWPSFAPDNSYYSWVFDGAHKNLHMFDDSEKKRAVVPIDKAPGIDGAEVYHPRWSNHLRFFAITGPYTGKTVTQTDGKKVEVYIGRFNEEITEVEDWLKISNNKHGDVLPDLWVAHGEKIDETGDNSPPPPKPSRSDKRDWPKTTGNLAFLWEDADPKTKNIADKDGRKSSVIAREQARFGRFFDMLCDGGYFEADEESSAKLSRLLDNDRYELTIEALATPGKAVQEGAVLSSDTFQIQQRGTDWVFVTTKPEAKAIWIGKAREGEPAHLAILFNGLEYTVLHNGEIVRPGENDPKADMLAAHRGLTFGEGWDGRLEGVYIAPGALDDWRVEQGYGYFAAKIKDRKPLPRIRLKAKLLEMTADRPVEALDTYRRALLGYLYEVEEVLEGEYDQEKVLVMHWTILDSKPLQSFPRRPGQTYELLIEPMFVEQEVDGKIERVPLHPELTGERQWNDLIELLEPYYDVATPQD